MPVLVNKLWNLSWTWKNSKSGIADSNVDNCIYVSVKFDIYLSSTTKKIEIINLRNLVWNNVLRISIFMMHDEIILITVSKITRSAINLIKSTIMLFFNILRKLKMNMGSIPMTTTICRNVSKASILTTPTKSGKDWARRSEPSFRRCAPPETSKSLSQTSCPGGTRRSHRQRSNLFKTWRTSTLERKTMRRPKPRSRTSHPSSRTKYRPSIALPSFPSSLS